MSHLQEERDDKVTWKQEMSLDSVDAFENSNQRLVRYSVDRIAKNNFGKRGCYVERHSKSLCNR